MPKVRFSLLEGFRFKVSFQTHPEDTRYLVDFVKEHFERDESAPIIKDDSGQGWQLMTPRARNKTQGGSDA